MKNNDDHTRDPKLFGRNKVDNWGINVMQEFSCGKEGIALSILPAIIILILLVLLSALIPGLVIIPRRMVSSVRTREKTLIVGSHDRETIREKVAPP